ncbi:MAG: tRNA lysidine(34) synthetase TilS [Candidatus Schekmanbacteria bacterium]|nr:tRNA lysidine(34) synthetase TilS [Candidatus Schekmanbacteria bacterium]
MDHIISKIREALSQYSLIEPEETIVIAVSGGADSVFLLHALNSYFREPLNLKLHIAHLNHSLRGDESDRDEAFVRDIAGTLGIEGTFGRINGMEEKKRLKTSLESACHYARLKFFQETAEKTGADKIATGHTLDDRIETFFINLLRGTSVSGLTGISPYNKTLKIIRPLINIRAYDIRSYLREAKIDFISDSSNLSDNFIRNRIRRKLIPVISELAPSFYESMQRTMEIASIEDEFIKKEAQRFKDDWIKPKGEVEIEVEKSALSSVDKAIAGRAVAGILSAFKKPWTRITSAHIKKIIDFISYSNPGDMLHLPGGVRVTNNYEKIMFSAETGKSTVNGIEVYFTPPGETSLEKLGITIEGKILERKDLKTLKTDSDTALIDLGKLKLPLKIRGREKGDFFSPLGFRGKKKLQDFFVDIKFPRHKRNKVPIFLSGDDIIWVGGFRISEHFKVDDKTTRVLQLKIIS